MNLRQGTEKGSRAFGHYRGPGRSKTQPASEAIRILVCANQSGGHSDPKPSASLHLLEKIIHTLVFHLQCHKDHKVQKVMTDPPSLSYKSPTCVKRF